MFAVGTHVRILSVDHLPYRRAPRLVGREAVVTDHVDDMYEVAVLHAGRVTTIVRWMFNAEDLQAA